MLRSLFAFVVAFTLCTVSSPPSAQAGPLRAVGRGLVKVAKFIHNHRPRLHRCR